MPGSQDPHWNIKEQVHLLERCWLALLHVGCTVEMAYELVGNCHVLTALMSEGILE
jgi:hypothetical protein